MSDCPRLLHARCLLYKLPARLRRRSFGRIKIRLRQAWHSSTAASPKAGFRFSFFAKKREPAVVQWQREGASSPRCLSPTHSCSFLECGYQQRWCARLG